MVNLSIDGFFIEFIFFKYSISQYIAVTQYKIIYMVFILISTVPSDLGTRHNCCLSCCISEVHEAISNLTYCQ